LIAPSKENGVIDREIVKGYVFEGGEGIGEINE